MRLNVIICQLVVFIILLSMDNHLILAQDFTNNFTLKSKRATWLEFFQEKIVIYCLDEDVKVDGTYYFRNLTNGTLGITIQYPFPVDEYHPFPHMIEVENYDFWQRRRLSMKPGITCLWQCSPRRNDIQFKDWMKLDLKYIDNWSLKLDFQILFKTALVVLTGQGR